MAFHFTSFKVLKWRVPNSRQPRRTWLAFSVVVCALVQWAGCSSRPSRIQAIAVDPGALSNQIMEQLDADASGTLSSAETEQLPPIHSGRSAYDTDGNGEISAVELESRLSEVFGHNVGVLPATCRVTRSGRPIAGVDVKFVPPKLLEGTLPPASGVTDESGVASLRLASEDMPESLQNSRAAVMRPGIYLVEVTHPQVQIPPQYNTETTLGKEVFSAVLNGPPLPIELKF